MELYHKMPVNMRSARIAVDRNFYRVAVIIRNPRKYAAKHGEKVLRDFIAKEMLITMDGTPNILNVLGFDKGMLLMLDYFCAHGEEKYGFTVQGDLAFWTKCYADADGDESTLISDCINAFQFAPGCNVKQNITHWPPGYLETPPYYSYSDVRPIVPEQRVEVLNCEDSPSYSPTTTVEQPQSPEYL
jgi:hypothetical protein